MVDFILRKSIATDAAILTSSKVVTMAITLISAMLLARILTLEEFGTYSQLLIIINLATTVFALGLPKSINFFLARAENVEEKQKFLSIYYTLSTLLSFVAGLVLVFSTPLIINYFDNHFIKRFMFVLAVLPWANIILSSIENVLIVYGKTKLIILFRVLNSIFLLLNIIIIEILNLGFKEYMIVFISVQTLFALSVYMIVRNISGILKFSFEISSIKKILRFSLPIGFASIIGVLSVQLDKLIIGNFASTEELAIYTNAAREMPLVIIASSLTAVLMPQLVRLLKQSKKVEAISLWGNAISISYTFICFFSIALVIFAPEVVSLLYSDKYLPGVSVFQIYSLVLLLRFTYFGMILNSMGKTKFIFYSSIASLVLNLLLSYSFYLYFGFIGPAIATLISLLLVQTLQLVATSKSIDIAMKNIFPWWDLGIITSVNILMGLVFLYLKKIIPIQMITGEIVESIILGVIWSCLYFLMMLKKIKYNWVILNGK